MEYFQATEYELVCPCHVALFTPGITVLYSTMREYRDTELDTVIQEVLADLSNSLNWPCIWLRGFCNLGKQVFSILFNSQKDFCKQNLDFPSEYNDILEVSDI